MKFNYTLWPDASHPPIHLGMTANSFGTPKNIAMRPAIGRGWAVVKNLQWVSLNDGMAIKAVGLAWLCAKVGNSDAFSGSCSVVIGRYCLSLLTVENLM